LAVAVDAGQAWRLARLFSETFRADALAAYGVDTAFLQDNHVFSARKGVLTGATRSTRQKLETELGWRVQETFETGIEKTVRWYLDRSDCWKPLSDRIYGGERLATCWRRRTSSRRWAAGFSDCLSGRGRLQSGLHQSLNWSGWASRSETALTRVTSAVSRKRLDLQLLDRATGMSALALPRRFELLHLTPGDV
jgi:hypothetical protein